MEINIEDIVKMQNFRRSINRTSLKEIQFYLNGKEVIIKPEVIEDFLGIGLCNMDFVSWYLTEDANAETVIDIETIKNNISRKEN